MKDELGGGIMKEFVTLRPKMYSYKVGNSESKKCKGIKNAWSRKPQASRIIRTAYLLEINPIDPNCCLDLPNMKLKRWK